MSLEACSPSNGLRCDPTTLAAVPRAAAEAGRVASPRRARRGRSTAPPSRARSRPDRWSPWCPRRATATATTSRSPAVERDALGMVRSGDELVVTVTAAGVAGHHRRAFVMPAALRRCRIASARLEKTAACGSASNRTRASGRSDCCRTGMKHQAHHCRGEGTMNQPDDGGRAVRRPAGARRPAGGGGHGRGCGRRRGRRQGRVCRDRRRDGMPRPKPRPEERTSPASGSTGPTTIREDLGTLAEEGS